MRNFTVVSIHFIFLFPPASEDLQGYNGYTTTHRPTHQSKKMRQKTERKRREREREREKIHLRIMRVKN